MIELLDTTAPNHNKPPLYRFYLGTRAFSALSKLFLKDYISSKNILLSFGQVYLEYLQCLQKNGLIEFKRDNVYFVNENLKGGLKMVSMFLEKCVKNCVQAVQNHEKKMKEKEQTAQQKEKADKTIAPFRLVIAKSAELRLKIAINQGRALDAIKIYKELRDDLRFPFTFIRSIFKLKESSVDKKDIDFFYINELSRIFRTNLDFKAYTPWYDYYNQFLWQMVGQAEKANPAIGQLISLKEELLPFEALYRFESLQAVDVLAVYFKSLFSEFSGLVDASNANYELNKKSDYYLICLKGLLLQLIQMSHYFGLREIFLRYLREFTKYFSSTLTYAQEMKQYWKDLIGEGILTVKQIVENSNDLIQEINYHKIRIGVTTKVVSYQGFMAEYKQLSHLYRVRVKQIQNNRRLEKGERYLSDEFYTLIADYARAFIESMQCSDRIAKVVQLMVNELQYVIEVSPFNADTKFRLMWFCGLLNHTERMIQIFFTNDIKSVQWESLGYWFIRTAIEFGVAENADLFADKMVKSYQQNQRQTSEYALKALKSLQLDRVDEYLSYRSCIANSYNSVLILYFLYQRYRFQSHSEYYLLKINQRVERFKSGVNCSFNADFKVMRNELFESKGFGSFYGLFNSYELLQKEVHLTLHEQALTKSLLEKNGENLLANVAELPKLEESIATFDASALFDFSRYSFQEGGVAFNPEESKYTMFRAAAYLENYKLVSQVRIGVVLLVNELNRFARTKQYNKEIMGELKEKVSKGIEKLQMAFGKMDYLCQTHAIAMIRKGLLESYSLLYLIKETVGKGKKLKFAVELVNESVNSLMQSLTRVMVDLRWRSKQPSDSKLLSVRDQQMQRQLSMDLLQFKRLFSKVQSLWKM